MDKKEDVRKLGPYIEPKYHTQKETARKVRYVLLHVVAKTNVRSKSQWSEHLFEFGLKKKTLNSIVLTLMDLLLLYDMFRSKPCLSLVFDSLFIKGE